MNLVISALENRRDYKKKQLDRATVTDNKTGSVPNPNKSDSDENPLLADRYSELDQLGDDLHTTLDGLSANKTQ